MLNSNSSRSRLRPGRLNEKGEEIEASDGRIAEN